jgi:hypothetical protein
MQNDFKKWWKETYHHKGEVVHATQESINKYFLAHPHHPKIKGVIFDKAVVISGGFTKLDIEGCSFLGGLTLENLSVFKDLVIKDIGVIGELTVSNVFLTRNLVINQNLGEVLSDGVKALKLCNYAMRGKIIFEK